MTDRKLLQQALDALEFPHDSEWSNKAKAIEALRQALAQPEQEELIQFKDGKWSYVRKPWVGLTDEEILSAAKEVPITCIRQRDYDLHFAPIIEAKLKEKNTK